MDALQLIWEDIVCDLDRRIPSLSTVLESRYDKDATFHDLIRALSEIRYLCEDPFLETDLILLKAYLTLWVESPNRTIYVHTGCTTYHKKLCGISIQYGDEIRLTGQTVCLHATV